MADQDFNIKVVTTADTSGLVKTRDEMRKIREEQERIKQDAGAKALFDRIPPGGRPPTPTAEKDTSLTGTAVGLGTIITLLTSATNKWKAFNDEQDKWVEGMIKAEEKTRALGLALVDMQDKARSAMRIDTEPLEQSFARLTHDVAVLKTEIALAFEAGQYEDVKKLTSDLGIVESQLNKVTVALQRQADAKQKAAQSELEKRVPGLKPDDQVKEADAQTQRILQNEQAAAKARAEGRDQEAEQFQRSADQYKASATPKQLEDLKRIHDLQNQINPPAPPSPVRQPQPGEPGGGEVGTGGPSLKGDAAANARGAELLKTQDASNKAIQDRLQELITMNREMLGIWR